MTDLLWLWASCYLLLAALRHAAGTVMHRDTPTPAPMPAVQLDPLKTDPMGVAQ